MKKYMIILVITIWATAILSLERWEIYTNTSHVYQTLLTDSKLYSISWGGIEEYSLSVDLDNIDLDLQDKLTTIDGLASNEIRTIYFKDNKIWAGSYNAGVTIIQNKQVHIINANNGLISDKVISIKKIDNLVYVVTEGGFSTFYELDNISFPILSRKYTEVSTSGALISNNINDIISFQGYTFIATDAGLIYFPNSALDNFSQWKFITKNNSQLLDNNIIKLAVKDNRIALASDQNIQIISDFFTTPSWNNYSFSGENSLIHIDEATIQTIEFNNVGELIFATGVWDETTTSMSDLSPSILSKIQTNGEISEFLNTTTPVKLLSASDPHYITLAEVGVKNIEVGPNMILVSTWGKGFLIYTNNTWYQYETNGIGFNAINYLTIDNDNKLWASCGYYGNVAIRKGARGVSSFDGENWQTYNMKNSPIQSDNINSITVGTDNKKWFGSWYSESSQSQGWKGGVTSFDEDTNHWRWYHSSGVFDYNENNNSYTDLVSGLPGLPSQTVSFLNTDRKGNIMMSLQSYGLAFYSPSGNERLAISPLYNSQNNFTRQSFHNEYGYFFSKSLAAAIVESAGLLYWNSQDLPSENDNSNWENIPVSDIRNSAINDIVEVKSPFGNQVWFAGNNGLFMYDGEFWYRYGIDIKREKWNFGWQVDTRYIVGETKLFAAKDTYPTSLEIDDYGCLWIGSEEAGITKYDTNTEEFFIYNKDSHPLLSNQIKALAYESSSGKLYIGASEGLCSVTVGSSTNPQKDFHKVVIVPNPFYPEKGQVLRIFNEPGDYMPSSAKICKIFDKSGQLVYDLPLNKYQSFSWDGNNKNGKKCSSGVYFYTISNAEGETVKGKFALIRD